MSSFQTEPSKTTFELHDKREFFYPFAKSLLRVSIVPFEFVEQFIQTFPAEQITFGFYSLVEALIHHVNALPPQNIVISALPLTSEHILWELSSKKCRESASFCQYLSFLYSLNDGAQMWIRNAS
jgi:hypothetical protein